MSATSRLVLGVAAAVAAIATVAVQAQAPAPDRFQGDRRAHVVRNGHIVPAAGDAPLVINLPQRMLFHVEAEDAITAYPIAIGRPDWPTPRGAFTVLTKQVDPTWHVPASILEESRRQGRTQPAVVPPGPANPLGARWIGLSLPGIGIHGTNVPSSIFRAASHGCIRMRPADVAAFFDQVAVGTAGVIVYEPVLLAEIDGRIYLEVHRDVYHPLGGSLDATVERLAAAAGVTDRIDWERARSMTAARLGMAGDITRPPPWPGAPESFRAP